MTDYFRFGGRKQKFFGSGGLSFVEKFFVFLGKVWWWFCRWVQSGESFGELTTEKRVFHRGFGLREVFSFM